MTDEIDKIVTDPRFLPYRGWHDDYSGKDRSSGSLPAIQQVRSELLDFIALVRNLGLFNSCLQLGLGTPGGAHRVFQKVFRVACTIELTPQVAQGYHERFPEDSGIIVSDTHNPLAKTLLGMKDIDVLFIDAGHKYEDVQSDFFDYAPLVRKGGLIALHDAVQVLPHEHKIEVWLFLEYLRAFKYDVKVVGKELGIAYIIKTWD